MIARITSNGEALRYFSPNKLDSMILLKKIREASNRGFCYFLSKSNVFVVLTNLRFIKTTNALRGVLQTAHSSLRTKRKCPRIAKTLSENKAEASLKMMKNEYEIEKEFSFSTVIFDKILI